VAALVELKSPKAQAFVEHFLAAKDEAGWQAPTLLDHLHKLDAKKTLEWSRKLLDHKSGRVRLQAAMTVLNAGEAERAIPILATLLEKGALYDIGGQAFEIVDALLKLGTKEATDAARGVLRNPALHGPDTAFRGDGWGSHSEMNRPAIVVRLAHAGHPEGYRIYLNLLDVKGNQYGSGTYGMPSPSTLSTKSWKLSARMI
jgi:hypothetical protein